MIERVSNLSPLDFRVHFQYPGRPVILTDAIEHWPARQRWTPEYLRDRYGTLPVDIEALAEDRGSDAAYFLENVRRSPSTIGDYLQGDFPTEPDGRRYAAMQPLTGKRAVLREDLGGLPYFSERMRSWSGQKIYLWMGPAGCRAALHIDPLPNFAVQIFGRKEWTIFPSAQQDRIYIPSDLPSPHFSPVDVEAPRLDRYPRFSDATPSTFELGPGEVLYLPPDWGHYVRSLDFAISLNMWWVRLHWRDLGRVTFNRLRKDG